MTTTFARVLAGPDALVPAALGAAVERWSLVPGGRGSSTFDADEPLPGANGRLRRGKARAALCEPLAESLAAPVFEREPESFVVRCAFPAGTTFYGTGEVPGPLARNRRRTTLWNSAASSYDQHTPALYQSHPWVLALLPDGSAVGLYADTAARGSIATTDRAARFAFEAPFDLWRFTSPSARGVLASLTARSGRCALPPLWALGYHQCRWSYRDAEEFRHLAHEFRTRAIPCDALWFDIDTLDRRRAFTWNRALFPDPKELVRELAERGFRSVAIINPGLSIARDYRVHRAGLAGDHFVRGPAGRRSVRGVVWPGACHFPDFARPATRAWWAAEVAAFVEETPLAGLWCDMNEPELFATATRTLPENARHRGDFAGPHAAFHNRYGEQMARATRAGLVGARPERRPFVLTRSNHLVGSQHAATWTGDNRSRWPDLRASIPMALNLGLSGQPFAGPDVGGFKGDPSAELFERWFELGAFLPFFRGHSRKDARRKEPWTFGPATEARVRCAIERRMRLLPTWYTLFAEAAQSGVPPVRPLWWAEPADPRLRSVDDAFLVGDDLLVAPIVYAGRRERVVPLPRAAATDREHPGWYAFEALGAGPRAGLRAGLRTGPPRGSRTTRSELRVAAPRGTLPLFARAGSILALTDVRQHTGEHTGEHLAEHTGGALWSALELHVFLDREGRARGRLFEDAGDGPAAEAFPGRATQSEFTARATDDALVWSERREGRAAARAGSLRLVVYGLPRRRRPVVVSAPRAARLRLPLTAPVRAGPRSGPPDQRGSS